MEQLQVYVLCKSDHQNCWFCALFLNWSTCLWFPWWEECLSCMGSSHLGWKGSVCSHQIKQIKKKVMAKENVWLTLHYVWYNKVLWTGSSFGVLGNEFYILMNLKMFLNKLSKEIRQIYRKYVNCKPREKNTYLQQVWPILQILCWATFLGRNVYKLHQETASQIHTLLSLPQLLL